MLDHPGLTPDTGKILSFFQNVHNFDAHPTFYLSTGGSYPEDKAAGA
jgi:hypothetical protein